VSHKSNSWTTDCSILGTPSGPSLSFEAINATDYKATVALIKSLCKPIGGCFLMSRVLSETTFVNQTEDDFEKVFEVKTTAFRNLSKAVDINTLDLFVSFSSIATLVGSAGQSNYTRYIMNMHFRCYRLLSPLATLYLPMKT
jgi:hypothetical protein